MTMREQASRHCRLRSWAFLPITSCRGFSLLEVLAAGALVVVAGAVLTKVSVDSHLHAERFGENLELRSLLNRVVAEVSLNSAHYLPFFTGTAKATKLYYACFSEKGAFEENDEGDVAYGIFSAATSYNLSATTTISDLKSNQVGFKVNNSGSGVKSRPCLSSRITVFIAPLPFEKDAYRALVWIYAVETGSHKIKGALADTVVLSPP